MNKFKVIAIASLMLSASFFAQAQSTGQTRSMVTMDRDTFLSMFRYDEQMSTWVLKSGMELPKGILSRDEVASMRDMFLSMHRWDESKSDFIPVSGGPRNMSSLSRDQVQMETTKFLMMHYFDERQSKWLKK